MANMADFSLKAKGSKESLLTLKEILECETQDRPYLFIYECYNAVIDNDNTLKAFGICKWSASVCLLKGDSSYYYDEFRKDDKNIRNLQDIAKELNLTIELFGNEIGYDFAEYYLINNNGEIISDDFIDGMSENAIKTIAPKFNLDENAISDYLNSDDDDEYFADLYDDDFDDNVFFSNGINTPTNYIIFDNGLKYEEFTI